MYVVLVSTILLIYIRMFTCIYDIDFFNECFSDDVHVFSCILSLHMSVGERVHCVIVSVDIITYVCRREGPLCYCICRYHYLCL